MNVIKYISELLYVHDCVIVPGFGGFVTNHSSAKVHPGQHSFWPPSKEISFNTNLNKNDGLLINHIAGSENLDYPSALEEVESFARQCNDTLTENKELSFIGIGKFKIDFESNIQFYPSNETNYLEDSYGLTKFVSPPIRRHRASITQEKKFIDRRPARKEVTEKRRVSRAVWLIAPAIILVLWGFFNADLFRDINQQYSGIIPFIRYSLEANQPDATQSKIESPVVELNSNMATDETLVLPDPENTEVADIEPETVDVKPKTTDPVKPPAEVVADNIYFIIAGAFKNINNAREFMDRLTAVGYEAEIVNQSPTGYWRVSYQGFVLKDDALKQLMAIRETENEQAWLLRK
jgi:cell division septation protein DedD/nucleoid DNA-binding protein